MTVDGVHSAASISVVSHLGLLFSFVRLVCGGQVGEAFACSSIPGVVEVSSLTPHKLYVLLHLRPVQSV